MASITISRPALRASRVRHSGGLTVGIVLLVVIVGVAVFGPLLLSSGPDDQNLDAYLQGPQAGHLFGTDALGRDLLTRVVYGARPSLLISFLGMIASISIGTTVGMLAAFGGRMADRVAGFAVDAQLALPYVVIAIVLVSIAGASKGLLIILMALAGWAQVARVARSVALSERSRDYVLAAEVVGASRRRVATKYVMPSVLPAILSLAPLQMAAMIVIEATLSFLGLGIKPPAPSWGSIMLEGKEYIDTAWWLTVFPGIAIFLTTIGLLLVGDGLQRRQAGGSVERLLAAPETIDARATEASS